MVHLCILCIDAPHGSKTLAGVLLARCEGVGNVYHFYEAMIQSMPDPVISIAMGDTIHALGMAGFPYFNVFNTIGPRNFRITKNDMLTIYLSISL